MLRKITKTYDEITVKAVVVNLTTLDVMELAVKLENYSKTKKIENQVAEIVTEKGFALSEILEKNVLKGTYWMTENEYFKLALPAKERPQGNYIARTLTFTDVTVIEVNTDKEGKRTAKERTYRLLGEFEPTAGLKAVKKSQETANKKVVAVKGVKTVEKLYIMTDEQFRSNAYDESKADK